MTEILHHRSEAEFFIPFRPIPKQSARFGNKKAWQPKRVKENAKVISMISKAAASAARWEVDDLPLAVQVHFVFKWPTSTRKAERSRWKLRTQTPDTDNLMKQFMDATLGFWMDDRQVAIKHLYKWNAPEEGIGCRILKLSDSHGLNLWSTSESLEWIMATLANHHRP